MSQHYSDPKRANDPHALPNVETFETRYGYCKHCGSLNLPVPGYGTQKWRHCEDCKRVALINRRGWFYQFCFPGCLPDSEPFGPYDTEAAAVADAQADDDNETIGADGDDVAETVIDEPDEDSITTSDHQTFYQYGKRVLWTDNDDANDTAREWFAADRRGTQSLGTFADCESAVRAYMNREQFYPSVFWISDHGNAHPIDISGPKGTK